MIIIKTGKQQNVKTVKITDGGECFCRKKQVIQGNNYLQIFENIICKNKKKDKTKTDLI